METSAKQKAFLHVAVGVIFNHSAEVLIAQRPKHKIGGGFWEFPGGKVEVNEEVESALGRELQEELNIHVNLSSPLIKFVYEYPDRTVLLDVWEIMQYQGEICPLEGQILEWVKPENLCKYNLLAANRPIVTSIQLPPYYFITPEAQDKPDFWQSLVAVLEGGISLIQLRSKQLSSSEYIVVAEKSLALCRKYSARLLLNHVDSLNILPAIKADGVHLSSTQLEMMKQRPVDFSYWVAGSCHNLQEIKKAEYLHIDFLVVGSILATPSHPQGKTLGWQGFKELLTHANLPVYALGGMTLKDITTVKSLGAQGIAGMRFIEALPSKQNHQQQHNFRSTIRQDQ